MGGVERHGMSIMNGLIRHELSPCWNWFGLACLMLGLARCVCQERHGLSIVLGKTWSVNYVWLDSDRYVNYGRKGLV